MGDEPFVEVEVRMRSLKELRRQPLELELDVKS